MTLSFERYDLIVEHYPAMWPMLVPGYVPICNAMLDVVRALQTQGFTETAENLLEMGRQRVGGDYLQPSAILDDNFRHLIRVHRRRIWVMIV